MSLIEFKSGTTKENARQELRNARAELLKKAERDAIKRKERLVQSQLRGDDHWMLPSISKRINEQNNSSDTDKNKLPKKLKKEKKKKHKKDKHHKKEKEYKSDESDDDRKLSSSANEEKRITKKRKNKKHKHQSSSGSSNSGSANSEEDEWIEKPVQSQQTSNNVNNEQGLTRDAWMSDIIIPTYSKSTKSIDLKKNEQSNINSYDPAKNVRELNPHWKNGGTGLPSLLFKKPSDHLIDPVRESKHSEPKPISNSNWRKSDYQKKTGNDDKSSDNWKKKSTAQHDTSHPSLKKSDEHLQNYSPSSRSPRSPSRHLSKKTIKRSDSSSSSTSSASSSSSPKNVNHNNKEAVDKKNNDKIVENTELKLNQSDFLTDQQMNEIGAKIIKANIFGNNALAEELSGKLERAREYRKSLKDNALKNNVQRNNKGVALKSTTKKQIGKDEAAEEEHILLTTTNSKGVSRPLMGKHQKNTTKAPPNVSDDRWGGRKSNSKKSNKKTIDTHSVAGERLRYFPDDDKYDIKQMFEKEKFVTAAEQDQQFMNIAGKHKNPNDDLDDVFADKVRKNIKDTDKQEEQRAVRQHIEMTRILDACDKCHPKPKFIIAMGKNVYLSLPWHEGLQLGHCILCPIEHSLCSTQLDEDVWLEMQDFRQALTQMFGSRKEDCIFFETARYLHKRPHMQIHCIPNKNFEMAPFYFKKAIQESEREWSTNKQLLELKCGGGGRNDVRRAIPKGLPYFWVHFGMDRGFAHVIEEQEQFPNDFAQEIIGGMLELNPREWRKPRAEHNIIQKVKQFADWWKPFDITNNN